MIGRNTNYPHITSKLNKMGKAGWELTSFGNSKMVCGKGDFIVAVFRRELVDGKRECQKCCPCPPKDAAPINTRVAHAVEVMSEHRMPERKLVAQEATQLCENKANFSGWLGEG